MLCVSCVKDCFPCVDNHVGHHCGTGGCGEVLVIDGNMKNNREVCFAVDAGYTEFSGLPGRVKTGCPNTPGFKSRYCPLHAKLAVTNHDDSKAEKLGIIVDKRVTRNSTSYQVCYHGNVCMCTLVYVCMFFVLCVCMRVNFCVRGTYVYQGLF